MKPIAKIIGLFREKSDQCLVQDMKWILNDIFLAILTKENEVLIFDSLLQVFQIQSKHEEVPSKQLYLEILGTTYTVSQEKEMNNQKLLKILGYRNQVNY